jgi:hypothetical protein
MIRPIVKAVVNAEGYHKNGVSTVYAFKIGEIGVLEWRNVGTDGCYFPMVLWRNDQARRAPIAMHLDQIEMVGIEVDGICLVVPH